MRNYYAAFVAVVGCMSVALPAAQALAQAAPSQAQLEQQLRPIPKALQGGHQGISAGAVVRFPSNGPTQASITLPASGGARVPHQASTQTATAHGCAAPVPEQGTVSLPQITFEFNSATLTPAAKAVLQTLGNALNGEKLADQKAFVLQGHTDAVGRASYNQELSLQRAEAAKAFLVNEMKVDGSRLQTQGKGFSELANPCNPRAAENRRLVVINPSQAG